jgi:hypothetical protein
MEIYSKWNCRYFILTLVRVSTDLICRVFLYQRAIYGALQMKLFPLIVGTDLYANESSKSAFRNQYKCPLSFQEVLKSGRKYLPTQRVPLGCSQARWYVTMKRCSNTQHHTQIRQLLDLVSRSEYWVSYVTQSTKNASTSKILLQPWRIPVRMTSARSVKSWSPRV